MNKESQRVNVHHHKKNVSSIVTARTRKSTNSKSKQNKEFTSKQKVLIQKRQQIQKIRVNNHIAQNELKQLNKQTIKSSKQKTHQSVSANNTARNSKQKSLNKQLKIRLSKRMSFESPHKLQKNDSQNYKNFTLLNYILLRQKGPHRIQQIDMGNLDMMDGEISNTQHQTHRHSRINSARMINNKRGSQNQHQTNHFNNLKVINNKAYQNANNQQRNHQQHNHHLHKQIKKVSETINFTKDDFKCLEVLGKGGFGRVMKVLEIRTNKIYAMKEMSKTLVITKKSIQSVLSQRQLLSQLNHPFLVNMTYAFQDEKNLYLIMQYMSGGDLRYQIGKYQKFPQHVLKFFVCCIILGLKYLHENSIIHRDIKPQNIILDQKGYLRITDLGIAKIHSHNTENYKDTSGTPGYMSPEVINRENHSFQVDFFALGVIAYQCMLGKRPYRGYNREEIRQQILLYEAAIKPNQLPQGYSKESMDFINKMLKRDPCERLGYNKASKKSLTKSDNKPVIIPDFNAIMSHPWFDDIEWDKMLMKKYSSPFIPDSDERNYDTVSQSQYDEGTIEKLRENSLLLRNKSIQDIFEDYQYKEQKMV